MESPTREIRCGLEALKLHGRVERVAKDVNPSTSTVEEMRNLQLSAVHIPGPDEYRLSCDTLAKACVQDHRRSQDGQHRDSMLRAHAECTTYGATNTRPQCSNSSQHQRRDGTEYSIENSLRVSDPSSIRSNWATGPSPAQSVVVVRSCREQAAAACTNTFDDTTVDDLAGYLDEIMFIPKPMSEMAELMYT